MMNMQYSSGTGKSPTQGINARTPFNLISREELKRLVWDDGMTDAQVATLYNVSTNQVHEKRRKMNLIHGQITTPQLTEIVRLAETIKTLPLEAIEEIRQVVERYTSLYH